MDARARAIVLCVLLLSACGDVPERSAPVPPDDTGAANRAGPAPAPADSVDVVFTRDEAPVTVRRAGTADAPPLAVALDALLAGPTPEERAAGLRSWFSETTAGALRSVEVDSAGHAIVDFGDLRRLIPNAGSSTGSTLLLLELNGTVFAVPRIQSVEYRIDGSCEAFWNWLQYSCHPVLRAAR